MGFVNQDLLQFIQHVLGQERPPVRVHSLVYDELRLVIDQMVGRICNSLEIVREVLKQPTNTSNHLIMILSKIPLRVRKESILPIERFVEHVPHTSVPFTDQAIALLLQTVEYGLAQLILTAVSTMTLAKRKTIETRDLPEMVTCVVPTGWRMIKTFLSLDDELYKLNPHAPSTVVEQVNRLLTFASHRIIQTCLTIIPNSQSTISKQVMNAALKWWYPSSNWSERAPRHFQLKHFRKMDRIDRLDDAALNSLIGSLEWLAHRFTGELELADHQFLNELGLYMV